MEKEQLELHYRNKKSGKEYKATVSVDYATAMQANKRIMKQSLNVNTTKKQTGSDVNVEMDMLAGGEYVLMKAGCFEGDNDIRTNFRLRAKASLEISTWIAQIMNASDDFESVDVETEKKSLNSLPSDQT